MSKTDTQEVQGNALTKLAKELALNHYNISITQKPDEKIKPDILNIGGLKGKQVEYTRNILVVGTGASHQVLPDILKLATPTLIELEEKLGLYKRLGRRWVKVGEDWKFVEATKSESDDESVSNSNPDPEYDFQTQERNRYLALVSKMESEVVDDLEAWFQDNYEAFEPRLALLVDFFGAKTVHDQLMKQVNYKYIPNLFLELTAHLFKHRFIDVIIDTNFDELLTNAIDDEFGSGDYHKVITHDDVTDIKQFMDDRRLKIPIYLKPHGSISNSRSLKYTYDHYINISPKMRDLMVEIFKGSVGDDKAKQVKRINVIIAGHSFSDDILPLIFKAFMEDNELEINFFKLKHNADAELEYPKKYHVMKSPERKFKDHVKVHYLEPSKVESDQEGYTFSQIFEELCDLIKKYFENEKGAYRAKGIHRHKFLCEMYSYWNQAFKEEGIIKPDLVRSKMPELLKLKMFGNFIYDLEKFENRIPLDELYEGRIYKYYRAHMREIQVRTSEDNQRSESDTEAEKNKSLVNRLNGFIVEEENTKAVPREYQVSDGMVSFDASNLPSIRELINQNFQFSGEETQALLEILNKAKLNRNINKSVPLEINESKWSKNTVLFSPIRPKQRLYTDLALYYKIQEFTEKYQNRFNLILASVRTGGAVFNILSDSKINKRFNARELKLNMITRNKDIYLKESLFKSAEGIWKSLFYEREVRFNQRNEHQMILFCNSEDEETKLLCGLYYKLLASGNRINPVCFSIDEDEDDNVDLLMMKDLFSQMWDEGESPKKYVMEKKKNPDTNYVRFHLSE